MLEIFAVMMLADNNAKKAAERGRSPGPYRTVTYLLLFGCEIIGFAAGAAISGGIAGAYLTALPAAAAGGLASYLIAANCTPGGYRQMQYSPLEGSVQLDFPRILTVSRLSAAAGSLSVYSIWLNGQNMGSLRNGESVQVTVNLEQNVITAEDGFGSEIKPLYFSVPSGGSSWICFNAQRFLPENSGGIIVLSDDDVSMMMQGHNNSLQLYPGGNGSDMQMHGMSVPSHPPAGQVPPEDISDTFSIQPSQTADKRSGLHELYMLCAMINFFSGGLLVFTEMVFCLVFRWSSGLSLLSGIGGFLLVLSILVFRHFSSRKFRVHKAVLVIQTLTAAVMTAFFLLLLPLGFFT